MDREGLGRAAVAAGVVKGLRAPLAITGHDDALVADLDHLVRTRFRHLIHRTDAKPVAEPQGLELSPVMVRVVVVVGRKRRGKGVNRLHIIHFAILRYRKGRFICGPRLLDAI